jgi:hypothetical protein
MKVKISAKQYVMLEKIARTKVGLNPQWWSNDDNNVVNTDDSCGIYEECVVTNLNGLIREAMVAKYLDGIGIAYDWWIPFASGNLVERVSEFHVSKHKIDVKPVVNIKFIENGEPMSDGRINVETLTQGFALDATQSYFRNNIDDIYIGVYLKDSLNGDIRGYQYRNSNKWRRYLRECNIYSEPKFNTAMCCPVNDLIAMNTFKDIDDIMFDKSSTSHRFIDANKHPAIPSSYTWSDKTDEYDMTFIETWCKEWKLVWDDGIFVRNAQDRKDRKFEGKGEMDIFDYHGTRTTVGHNIAKVVNDNARKKANNENRRKKLGEEYDNVKRKLKEDDHKRKLNDEYENMKRKLKEDSSKTSKIEKMEHGNMKKMENGNMENTENLEVDVLGITGDIVARSEKWKELTDKIKIMSDKKDKKTKRKEELEAELVDIDNEIGELSVKIDDFKKESKIIEDSFRLIDNVKKKVEGKN